MRIAGSVAWVVLSVSLLACGSGETGPSTATLPRTETSLALGSLHTCALTASGAAYCWGRNVNGQLGDGTQLDRVTPTPVLMPGGVVLTQISAASNYTCAVSAKHELYCWGTIPPSAIPQPTPQLVAGAPQVQAVSVGYSLGCALDLSGSAYCWGVNSQGQLGNGDSTNTSTPMKVKGGVTLESISTGLNATCGRVSSGQAYCWGSNLQRVTGVAGLPTSVITPSPVQGGMTFTSVVTGATLSCGILSGGAGYCWGQSYYGSGGFGVINELAPDPPVTFATPTALAGALTFKSLAPGNGNDIFDATCGVVTDGSAYCWGINSSGQLGTSAALPNSCTALGNSYSCTNVPIAVTTSTKFLHLVSGAETTCGITTAHALMCWGRNGYGEVGDGTTTNAPTPVAVKGSLILP